MTVVTKKEVAGFSDLYQQCWSGALQTLEMIEQLGKEEELMELLDEMFPDEVDDTELNDFIWFDAENYIDLEEEEEEEEE